MTRNIIILTIVMIAAAGYTFYMDFSKSHSHPTTVITKNQDNFQPVPVFEFPDLKNKSHKISDFEDKAIVLNFWASWCTPCLVEFPQMLKLAAQSKDSQFVFLSIDENKEDIEKFIKKQKSIPSNVIIGWDQNKKISENLFLTTMVPETFLIAPGLIIHEKVIGDSVKWDSPEMQQKLKALRDFSDP